MSRTVPRPARLAAGLLAAVLCAVPAAADTGTPGLGLDAGDHDFLPGTAGTTGSAWTGYNPDLRAPRDPGVLGGFLDSDRLSLSHSLSFGYQSTGYGDASAGLWVSRLGYRISDPLRISADVGLYVPTDGSDVLDAGNVFLRGLDLDYRPGDSFRLNISYRGAPRGANPFLTSGTGFATGPFGRTTR